MMKSVQLIASILFFVSTLPAQAPAAKTYRSQYTQLREKVIGLVTRSQETSVDRAALQEERLALLKLTHRLQEEAMHDYYEGRTGSRDKLFLFVVQASSAMGFTLESLG